MKRFTIIMSLCLLFLLSTTMLFSQSLQDNPDYRKSIELKRLSDIAFEDGDYLRAKQLAEEASVYSEKSDAWIVIQLSKYKANSALRRVERNLSTIKGWGREKRFPVEYAEGLAAYEEASVLYRAQEFTDSYEKSQEALAALEIIMNSPPEKASKPAAYVVRLNPEDRDCLWKIAAYDFVYGDPWKWKQLYEANKESFPEPGNPSLIEPGMILKIPALEGELRSGTWDNGTVK